MYIDLTTDCDCGCCGLRFINNNIAEYAIQEQPMNDPRLVSNIDFSVEIWARLRNIGPGVQCIATNYDPANNNGFWALIRNGNLLEFVAGVNIGSAAVFANRIAIFSNPFTFNTWLHIVANRITNNPVYWEIYVNGQKQNNGGINLNPNFDHYLNLNQKTKFGWWGFDGNNAFFSGDIAQSRLYARPLAQAEIRYNLQHGFYRPFSIEDIYFWAPFNNCVGVIADAFASNATGGGAQIILNNFGNRIVAGGGAWIDDCPADDPILQACIGNEDCKEKPTDEIIIQRCDNLLFPAYTRKNPFINFSNFNTYNLYIDCVRQLFFESGWDWYQRNATNWAFTPNNLQTFELYLDLSNFKPQIVNLTVHKYTCNEVTQVIDLAQIFPTLPTTQQILNTIISWLEVNIFPNSQVSVSGVANTTDQFILSVSVPPTNVICDNRMIALSKPGALRPGQEVPVNPPEPEGDGIVIQCCTRLNWNNAEGASNFCRSEAPPPDDPPGDLCEDEEDVNVPFDVDENCLGLAVVDGCVEFSQPGTYALQYFLTAAIDQLFGWQKTTCLSGRVRVLIQMQVLDQVQTIYDYDYVKNGQLTDNCVSGTLFWDANTSSESATNPLSTASFGTPVTQINVTQQHIDDGDNRICLRTLVQTRAQLTCFGCEDVVPALCCEGTIGSTVSNTLNNWGAGIQKTNPWVYVEDTNSAAGGTTINVSNTCFLGLNGNVGACIPASGVTVENSQIKFDAPGDYTLNVNFEYLRFVCFLWENTKCLKGNGTINLYLNVFGVQTLIDTYTISKDQAVDCNMPISGGSPSPICEPVAFNNASPPAGIPVNLSIPINYAGGPNNTICFETNGTFTADYIGCNDDCTGGQVPGQPVCRTIPTNANDSVSCNVIATPPDIPTDTCDNLKTGNFIFTGTGTNSAEFFYDSISGCLEILQPGNYTIDLLNIVGSLLFEHNTANLDNTLSHHDGVIFLNIGNLPPIPIVAALPGSSIGSTFGAYTFTNTSNCFANLSHTVTNGPLNTQINLNVTPAMITANQNRICFQFSAYASVVSPGTYCNPAENGTALAATTPSIQGSLRICKVQASPSVAGRVAIQAANFLRGTFSICQDSEPTIDERFIEAIGEVTVNGSLQICQSKQIPANCSYFTYNKSESINCTISVPHTDSLPIPPCENDQLTPGFNVPLATTVQDPLLVDGGNCITFSQPGSYTIEINLTYVARKILAHNNISCFNTQAEVIPYLVFQNNPAQTLTPIDITLNVNPSICGPSNPQFTGSESFTGFSNINITQQQIDDGDNEVCVFLGLRVFAEICGITCPGTDPRSLAVTLQSTITGDVLVCRNPSPPPAFQTEGTNWFGAETFANNRDRFLEDCFNVRSCFTGYVFWSNLCLRLWRDVICIKDNGTMLELPCNFQKLVDQNGACRNLFQKMRLGYSYLDLLTDRHVAFCSQPIRVVGSCDTILIRFKNDNEIYKTVRIEGTIEKVSFNKNQEVSYSSKGINRKLYSAVSREWEMQTGYYTQRFHVELMRALESDYFEAEIEGKWERFIFEDTYQIEWDDAEPGQKRGKATLKLKSYQRDVYNDFCVFEN